MKATLRSLSAGKEKGKRRGDQAFRELQEAYRRVFFDKGATPDDQEVVLADLAAYCGFFFAQNPDTGADGLREANAMRRVFARILRLGLSENSNLSALYRAAVTETIADQEEGRSL